MPRVIEDEQTEMAVRDPLQILTKRQDWLKALAYRNVRNHADAEDVVQEFLLEVTRRAEQLYVRDEQQFLSWAAQRIRFLSLNLIQKKKNRAEVAEAEADHVTDVGTPSWIHDFWKCFDQLSQEERQLLRRIILGDEKHQDIAAEKNVSNATITSRKQQALQRLKQLLLAAGWECSDDEHTIELRKQAHSAGDQS